MLQKKIPLPLIKIRRGRTRVSLGLSLKRARRAIQAPRRTTPRTKSLRKNIFTAELKGIGRETVTSISPS